jgi:hypothetical protein
MLTAATAWARLTPGLSRASSSNHGLPRSVMPPPGIVRSGMITSTMESGTQKSDTMPRSLPWNPAGATPVTA